MVYFSRAELAEADARSTAKTLAAMIERVGEVDLGHMR